MELLGEGAVINEDNVELHYVIYQEGGELILSGNFDNVEFTHVFDLKEEC